MNSKASDLSSKGPEAVQDAQRALEINPGWHKAGRQLPETFRWPLRMAFGLENRRIPISLLINYDKIVQFQFPV